MKQSSEIPDAPGALPLIGHAVPLYRNPLRFLRSLPICGDLARVRIGRLEGIMLCSADATRQVLADGRTFEKGGPVFDKFREVLGNGLVTCRHADHSRQRRLVQPAFQRKRFPAYAAAMTEQIGRAIGAWVDEGTVDLLPEMLTMTARITVATMFTGAAETPLFETIVEDSNAILQGFYPYGFMPSWASRIPTPGNRRYWQAHARLRRIYGEIIADYRSQGADRGDLLSMLLAADNKTDDPHLDQGLSDSEVGDQVMTFFLGGMETAASTLTSALYLLANNPEVEKRLQTEADAVLDGAVAAYADLPALELTNQIITETLRMYPPVWILTRLTTEDTELSGYQIPAGTTVVYSPYLVHHHPDLYRDAERFNPDRWQPGHADQPPPGSLIPFGSGPRKCIGDAFGVTEATLALASIATRWHLEPTPDSRVRATPQITLAPRGLRVRTVARRGPVPESSVVIQDECPMDVDRVE